MKHLAKIDENVLLVILQLKDNAYIVTIKKRLEKYLGKNVSLGTIYLSLKRLIRDGYIVSRIGDSTSVKGGKSIKYYRLTKSGINKLYEIEQLFKVMWEGFNKQTNDYPDLI
ncbi:PadR family transcriptional regulator [candidate division KSB1 bacterium]